MKKALYIGHAHHNVTRSSHFFISIISSYFEIDTISVDPADKKGSLRSILSVEISAYDCIFLWQIDYLASFFLARKVPVVVLPMYDGSSTLAGPHWEAIKSSLIISFSLDLHRIASKYGCNSIYVRYCPSLDEADAALSEQKIGDFQDDDRPLRVFFWERLPLSDIRIENCLEMVSMLNLESFHWHRASDTNNAELSTKVSLNSQIPIKTSNWFASKGEYFTLLNEADLFIAPRYSEGIGMGFLEAMARGCCVVANDSSTHNEYISNWRNGILARFGEGRTILNASNATIRNLGRQAASDCKEWITSWEQFYKHIMVKEISGYIESFSFACTGNASSPIRTSFAGNQDEKELNSLLSAHNDWPAYWSYIDSILAKHSLRSERGPVMPRVNRLVRANRYSEALSLLQSVEPNGAIYKKIKLQLEARILLDSSKHSLEPSNSDSIYNAI